MKENLHIFYSPEAATAGIGGTIYLNDEESAHCCRVLRLNEGCEIAVADGVGGVYSAILTVCSKNSCAAKLTEQFNDIPIRQYYNHIAIAPTKNADRIEWFVEKAVEFGVDLITPLLCRHSERKVLKTDRLEKIILSAFKQSGNAILPKIAPLTPFAEVIKNANEDIKMIAHCESGQKVFFTKTAKPNSRTITLIGPEGDFSEDEIALALNSGFKPISLGITRLRTETAGVAVASFLAAINN
ncbi:MAG: 16S rRNA (uracil(1498)-N(3))-methyltransferase [Bacteroidales bacterium]|nr:16S rRNA (uracil(1498)-N(3))-methyltransferase [Bacteroidales bacterium]MBR4215750.1 16S rRNA (uracil(1498)-N(3))-methyltransferase [Bacteroidales bacterium]